MARTRYLDYRTSDATATLNNWRRGMIDAGVYLGYTAIPGSSGMNVSLQMATDPDNTGAKLGKLVTPDGVVIEEDADLTDVDAAANGDATNLRIDYLVCSYIYNASLPNNDVTYEILTGTPGAPPTPPTLTDDQVLIAELWIPATTTAITTDMIRNVEPKKFLDVTDVSTRNFADVLRQGVYTGLNLKEGTAANKLTITAGTAITGEGYKISESSDLVDELDIDDNAASGNIRYDVIVALYRAGNGSPVEYLAVKGVEATYGAATPVVPSDSDIVTAATAYSYQYDDINYIVKLGYLEVYSTFATSWGVTYYQYPRLLKDIVWYVHGGIEDANFVGPNYGTHWPWTGHAGLLAALVTARDLVDDYYAGGQEVLTDTPITIMLSGKIRVPYKLAFAIPSYVKLQGIGSAHIEMPQDSAFGVGFIQGGFSQNGLDAADVVLKKSGDGVPQTGVPGGYERVEIEIGAVTPAKKQPFNYLVNGLVDFNFSGDENGGDEVGIMLSSGTIYKGWFEKMSTTVLSGDWAFSCIFPTGEPISSGSVIQIYIRKHCNAVKNLKVGNDAASPAQRCFYSARAGDRCVIEDVVMQDFDGDIYHQYCVYRNIEVYDGIWTQNN